MKTLTLAAALTLVLHTLACGGRASDAAAKPTPTVADTDANANQGLDSESRERLRNLLFADESPEELISHTDTSGPGGDSDPWRSFASASARMKEGKAEEAKRDLRRVLSMPDPETRFLLSAWTALRALGERPRPVEADRVQGVVFELHNEAGIGTVAAYRDGRARYYGGQGAAAFWEAPHADKEIDALIDEFLKAAEPFVKKSPAAERHNAVPVKLDHIRVTVLTFGGVHVTDVHGPSMQDGHYAEPIIYASVGLLEAIMKKGEEQGKQPNS